MRSLWLCALLIATAGAGLVGCSLLESSPNQTYVPAAARHQTARHLARLQQAGPFPDDTVRLVLTGDSQRYYDEARALVASVNQLPNPDLLLLAGDISDFGLSREMRWMHRLLAPLRVPYLTVIGNHDAVGNGRAAYQEQFGPLNYSFVYRGIRFICLDTNGREYGFGGRVPDMPWLQQQLADTAGVRRMVVVSHVPPTDEDFDPALKTAYTQALRTAPRPVLHLSGHIHRFTAGQPFHDGVVYLTANSFRKQRYQVLRLTGRQFFQLTTVAYGAAK